LEYPQMFVSELPIQVSGNQLGQESKFMNSVRILFEFYGKQNQLKLPNLR
jgi:hypothetical protein